MNNSPRSFPVVLVVPIVSLVVVQAQPADPSFRVKSIDAGPSETVAVADLNNDRKPNIISAENRYEAPAWTKHPLRPINRACGYVSPIRRTSAGRVA